MIVLAPFETWPESAPLVPRAGLPAMVPVPFPAVLNLGIDQFIKTRNHRPTHVVLGPDAWARFEEFFEFSRVLREKRSDDPELESVMRGGHVDKVNGVTIVLGVEEGMILLFDPVEA